MRRGHLAVEFIFIVALWSFLLSGVLSMFRTSLARRRMEALARFGTLTGSMKGVNPDLLANELQRVAEILKLDGAEVRIETGRFLGTPSSRFYDLFQTRVIRGHQTTLVAQREGSS